MGSFVSRSLTNAFAATMEAQERAELTAFAEGQRDSWFARLRAECSEATKVAAG